jgi:dihydropteroate synthase
MSAQKKQIMGILNITPDSFYDGGKFFSHEEAYLHAVNLKSEGADIIDIGGESTRPGAESIGAQEEIDRILPVVERLKKNIDIRISIDTTKSDVAGECLKAGADIINDISGFKFDPRMAEIVSQYNCETVLMHIQGKPENMQENISYENLIEDIRIALLNSVATAINAGIKKEKIIIDPGIGFGKEIEHNYQIINAIKDFKNTGYRVLLGLSQKSLIWKLYNDKTIDRLPATIALNMIGIYNGADIIRVHDVKQHRLALDAVEYLMENRI